MGAELRAGLGDADTTWLDADLGEPRRTRQHPNVETFAPMPEHADINGSSPAQSAWISRQSAGRDLNPRLYGFAGRSLGPLGHRRDA